MAAARMRRSAVCLLLAVVLIDGLSTELRADGGGQTGPPETHAMRGHSVTVSAVESDLSAQHATAEHVESEPPKLSPRSQRQSKATHPNQANSGGRALVTVISSLGIVLGLFLAVAWFTRKAMPKATMSLPKEVIEVLGRAALSHRQHVQLVRVGRKMLLLSVTPTGAETLTEITEPEEVDRIAGICQQNQPESISATFRQVISGFGSEPASGDLNPSYETIEA